jgi:hypothetical protein
MTWEQPIGYLNMTHHLSFKPEAKSVLCQLPEPETAWKTLSAPTSHFDAPRADIWGRELPKSSPHGVPPTNRPNRKPKGDR